MCLKLNSIRNNTQPAAQICPHFLQTSNSKAPNTMASADPKTVSYCVVDVAVDCKAGWPVIFTKESKRKTQQKQNNSSLQGNAVVNGIYNVDTHCGRLGGEWHWIFPWPCSRYLCTVAADRGCLHIIVSSCEGPAQIFVITATLLSITERNLEHSHSPSDSHGCLWWPWTVVCSRT